MRKTLYVARNELNSLFYSPIAWVMIILFIILTSADYLWQLDIYSFYYQIKGPSLLQLQDITFQIIDGPGGGFFPKIIGDLYLFLPLVTMTLISREVSSGSIKLLQSSPLCVRQVVYGKFLAMMAFVTCLMVFVAGNLIALSFSIIHPDIIQMLASSFGLFLVLLTYAAIGLFVSALTSYQVVAAIITLSIFSVLNVAGKYFQDNVWVRNISWYLGLPQKSKDLLKGLINIRDIAYFILLIGSFLAFTITKLKSRTESVHWMRKLGRYTMIVTIAMIVGTITENPWLNRYFDASRGKIFTITPPTQEALKALDKGPLLITAYANLFDERYTSLTPTSINDYMQNKWEPYVRFKPDIKLRFVDYYHFDSASSLALTNRKKSFSQILDEQTDAIDMRPGDFIPDSIVEKEVNLRSEEYRRFFLLDYNGNKQVLRTFYDNPYFPDENEIAAAIKRMEVTPPMVAFLKDEIERGYSIQSRDYAGLTALKGFRFTLINQGYDFESVSLKGISKIPDSLASLVISDPRTPFPSESVDKINRYIDNGGNLMIAAEPDRREMIKPILGKLGVSLRDGLLLQKNRRSSGDLIYAYMTDTAQHLSHELERSVRNAKVIRPNDTCFMVSMSSACALDYIEKEGFKIYPLLYTHPDRTWNRLRPIESDSLKLPVDRRPEDESATFVTAIMMTRMIHGREQRIFISGDADLFSSTMPSVPDATTFNNGLGFAMFSRFSYGRFPANTMRPLSIENAMTVTDSGVEFQKRIFYWVIPGVLGLFASVLLIRRKRK